jgi:glycerol-3-phosphate dehydrogenase
MRGYSVALIDKGDFANGTSSKSSKLVHGGIRYLELFQFGLVFEASRERRTLLQIAPHLVRPLPFIFPVYRDARWAPWMIDAGLWMYDALALFRNVGRHQMLSTRAVGEKTRGIDTRNIAGGAYYFDAQVDDARLTLETIRSAHQHQAVITNYVAVDSLIKENDRVVGVNAHDTLNGDQVAIRARVVVNATGPWTDALMQMDDPHAPRRLLPTKGAHVLVPRERIGTENAVTFPSFMDQRIMFLIPWSNFTLIGTTETDYDGDYEQVHVDVRDVEYVLAATNHAFPLAQLTKADVVSTYAGLRPLVKAGDRDAHSTSREHSIWVSESGLVTITGGKLTTYRAMAEQLVDLVAKKLLIEFNIAPKQKCATALTMLVEEQGAIPPMNPPVDVMAHLIYAYGPAQWRVLEIARHDGRAVKRIVEDLPYLWAEVDYAIENEMPVTLTDMLARRLHILNEARDNGAAIAPHVAERMARALHWDKPRVKHELCAYQEQMELARKF